MNEEGNSKCKSADSSFKFADYIISSIKKPLLVIRVVCIEVIFLIFNKLSLSLKDY